ncbi:hypothetical protein [Clostridium botulinum]|nr:hypothetical protein [Clostridium botulinum]MBY6773710.1 hypothetical protein [Clostridium botulinum]MBY6864248.1 hypothetical protein [Clostridium botulinum]MBY6984808.1 hypothetical protein [Clostridium botulinum]
MPKINVSFKKTKKDMKLYDITISKEEKSEFVKKCIAYYIEKEGEE